MKSIEIAKIAHQANKAYCEAVGDNSQPDWADAPEWQRRSAINGVEFHRQNVDDGPQHSHAEWMRQKCEDGWKYGPVKDAETKEHPCMVPYADLPIEQKLKDELFVAIVHALM